MSIKTGMFLFLDNIIRGLFEFLKFKIQKTAERGGVHLKFYILSKNLLNFIKNKAFYETHFLICQNSILFLPRETSTFRHYLLQRRYSPNTIKTYCDCIQTFLAYTKKPASHINNEDVEHFNYQYII